MGCATAYWLRQLDPTLRVVIVEAEQLAHGASGRNAGFLLLGTHTDYALAVDAMGRDQARRLWEFTAENARLIAELDQLAFDLQLSGSMIAAGDGAEAERLERSAELLTEDGVDVEYLNGAETNRRLMSNAYLAGLYVKEGGMLDPAKLVRHLAAQSQATVVEKWPVEGVESEGTGVRLYSKRGAIKAAKVVLTLNAYLPKLIPTLNQFVRPVRAQMMATEPVPLMLDHPVYSHAGFFYIRQRVDSRIMLGGARHLHLDEEVGYEDAITEPLQADLEAYLANHFPRIGTPAIERRWSGTMGFSPDSLPVVGCVPGVPNSTYATGFTGHGMGFSVRFGKLLARAVLGGKDEAGNLFSVDRLQLS